MMWEGGGLKGLEGGGISLLLKCWKGVSQPRRG